MFHRFMFRGVVGCVALVAALFVSGCGGQQISSTAQDRSMVEGNDAEMAESGGITPDKARVGEETLPLGSETTPGSSAASSSEPETEAVAEPEVAAVPGGEPTTESSPSAAADEPEMIAGLSPEVPSAATPDASAAAAVLGDSVLEDIYFDFDLFALRDDARATLEANAAYLKQHKGWHLTIEGHCDERGTEAYNLVLGERRAATVKKYLGDLGVAVADIKIISFGKERPFCTDHNDDCWKSNRRAHFTIK